MNSPAPHTASPSGNGTTKSAHKGPKSRGPRANPPKPGHRAAESARAPAEGSGEFILYSCTALTLVCLPPGPPPRHALADAARLTGVHLEMLRYYCRLGLLDTRQHAVTGEPTFDNAALEEICRIEHFRRYLGVHRRALPLICQLRRECERMQIKLAFLGDTWSEGAWGRRD
jgi:hypothetical protein